MADFDQNTRPACPFCQFQVRSNSDEDVYVLMHHLELSHPENGYSPFMVRDRSSSRNGSRSRSSGRSASCMREGAAPGRSRSLTPSVDNEDGDVYVDCPVECGEAVHIRELQDHMDLHEIENLSVDGYQQLQRSRSSSAHSLRPDKGIPPSEPRTPREDSTDGELLKVPAARPSARKTRQSSSHHSFKGLFLGPAPRKTRSTQQEPTVGNVKRLGKAELGPHAFEERMPAWLHKQLERGAKVSLETLIDSSGRLTRVETVANETPGIIPILAQLCQQDVNLSKVFLCHPAVKHVFKTPREGGFCGYRNIQMLVSFMQGTCFPGHQHFPGRTPSILYLQDLIEQAWDQGINSSARIETGGIKGTRKYIGTPEAQALFCGLGIGCEANAFNRGRDRKKDRRYVHEMVLETVLAYFSYGVSDPTLKIYQTGLAPIYFQHPGHSLTIVGLEVRKNGAMNLLVLDPMFQTAPGITRLLGTTFRSSAPEKLLKAYRRGDLYLGKYNSFEILKLMAPLSSHPKGPVEGNATIAQDR